MTDPVIHLLVGPNGAGKSTLAETIIGPVTRLEFVNADVIAAQQWPHATVDHAYEAARMAAQRRAEPSPNKHRSSPKQSSPTNPN